jgi:threonine dehydrogenase-like Zn-dependent dehydrogenase
LSFHVLGTDFLSGVCLGKECGKEISMKALTWHGKNDIRCDTVPDPKIEHGRDAIIKVTACAICGSDLHLFDGVMPTMEKGDVLGHETMGEVLEVGSENKKLKVGDRVLVPFTISCGECFFCKKGFFSGCERSNPNHKMAEKLWGHSPAGLFGYSHMLGGYAGGQAEYLRVPYADVGPIKVPPGLSDEQVLFLSDIFPTGFMAADFCNLEGARRSRCGAAVPWGSSRSRALSCWVPSE